MKILITTIGTRGDVQPYLALAVGLKAAGHDVVICTSDRFCEFITDYGIGFEKLDDGLLQLLESKFGRAIFENLNGLLGVLRTIPKVIKMVGPIHRRMVDDCWAAVDSHQPDLIIYHPKMFCAPAFAAVKKIPVILAMLCPMHVPTGDSPLFGRSFGRYYNRCTYRFIQWITTVSTQKYLRHWRDKYDKLGLSKHSTSTHVTKNKPIAVIHAHSQFVYPRPLDWPEYASVVGYWFLSQKSNKEIAWKPPAALVKFLEEGSAPVYFGFGSMSGVDPSKVTDTILSAVKKSGVRAIIVTGWGGITAIGVASTDNASTENTENIFVLESAPHEWLLPKVAAVVHHGGAGTTAAALRAGCPNIICPFGLDQPFWGKQVAKLGAGVQPIPQKTMTATILAQAIDMVTGDQAYQTAAKKIAQFIQNEDGIVQAINTIEKIHQVHID
ncbi:MAG: glycosyltransferase [Colwellia sp.]